MKLKELARDIVSLGGIPFFLLVLVRMSILPSWVYFFKILIAGILFFTIYPFMKQEFHSGLAIIILIFLSFNYNDLIFTIFSSIAYISMLVSLVYLKEKKRKVLFGIVFGVAASLLSIFLVNLYA
jgi:hypothetical protein